MATPEKKKRKRFDFLEKEKGARPEAGAGLPRVGRFDHLEIGHLRPPPAPPPARTACPHCGQPNEPEREACWACSKALKKGEPAAPPAHRRQPPPPPQAEVTLVIDGLTYTSNDPSLPEDVRALMDRIAKEGFSQTLLDDWRAHREERRRRAPQAELAGAEPKSSHPPSEVEVFEGQRVSVIKVDGKVYLSDAKDLPPRIRELFDYIERNGVTPQLMEHLRARGNTAKLRPATTARPTDGDISFWRDVEVSRQVRLRSPFWPDPELLGRLFYYLAPVWFLVEAVSWPNFRAGAVTGGSGLGNFLFYALEAGIGAGFWCGRPWAGQAALAENILYLAATFIAIATAPLRLASAITANGTDAASMARHAGAPSVGIAFSVFFVAYAVRQFFHGRAR
ncbi:MAG: hypothetical protein HY927_03750 [Elusimicrobia bacterium]|nr:hypothetical protein [Elusimicrobiota bacterium]